MTALGRALALACAIGLAWFGLNAAVMGITRPDYIAFLFGLLFFVLAAIAVEVGVRRVEA